MKKKPDIAIIGPGRVGTAIAKLARGAGYRIAAVAGRDAARAAHAAETIGPGVTMCDPAQAARAAALVLLTVPDDAIEPVCRRLGEAGAFGRGAVVAHCSGALSSDVLAAARVKCGCSIASVHPLQTFPTVEAAIERLAGSYFFCEGDDAALEVLERLVADIGGKAMRIDAAAKAAYHAAAVMACNHLVSLIDAAGQLAGLAGIDPTVYLAACEPMVRAAVENVFSMGPGRALTGPVARGDVSTITGHVEALRAAPAELRRFYAAAARWTVDLALRNGRIDGPTARLLLERLDELS